MTARNEPGASKNMGVGLQLSNGNEEMQYEEGEFSEFAGPIYLPAEGKCINWGGFIEDSVYDETDVHCGA